MVAIFRVKNNEIVRKNSILNSLSRSSIFYVPSSTIFGVSKINRWFEEKRVWTCARERKLNCFRFGNHKTFHRSNVIPPTHSQFRSISLFQMHGDKAFCECTSLKAKLNFMLFWAAACAVAHYCWWHLARATKGTHRNCFKLIKFRRFVLFGLLPTAEQTGLHIFYWKCFHF